MHTPTIKVTVKIADNITTGFTKHVTPMTSTDIPSVCLLNYKLYEEYIVEWTSS